MLNRRVRAHLWSAGLVFSGGEAFLMVWLLIPAPCWWAGSAGYGAIVLNSLLTRLIRGHAIGVPKKAFIGWGLVVNAIRMLTLIVIFAYITLFFEDVRGSFLISGLSAFFVMMPVEVLQLFTSRTKADENLECTCDANKYN
jgi:hypothetical protein